MHNYEGNLKKEIKPQIDKWMEKFQVKGKKTDKIKSLSKGNQQKIQLIATLIHQPKLVILDEPFSGLDPVNASLLEAGIKELKKQGASVIFSSHNMNNVEDICDHLVMLRDGKMVLDGTVREIREQFGRKKLFLETLVSSDELKKMPGVLKVETTKDGLKVLDLEHPEDGKAIFGKVTKNGYITTFSQQPPTIEEIFKMKAGEPIE